MSSDVDPERWTSLYDELRWIELHWTTQVQKQEQRVATVLTTNGILLSFVAVGAFDRGVQAHAWTAHILLAALLSLSVAMLLGVAALFPRIPMPFPPWLDARGVIEDASKPVDEHQERLSRALATSLSEGRHQTTLRWRRWLLRSQLVVIAISVGLLGASLVALLALHR